MTSIIEDQMRLSREAAARDKWAGMDSTAVRNAILNERYNKPPARKEHEHARISDEPMILPSDSADRKAIPIGTGVLDYFPRAMVALAMLSKAGNDQHNPGQPLHWSKGKSTDHPDCIIRHFIDRGKIDPVSGYLHDVGLAWRAIANLEMVLEKLQ